MEDLNLPGREFAAITYIAGAIVVCIAAAILRKHIRVDSKLSWFLLAVLAPIPSLFGKPLAGLVALPTTSVLPSAAIVIILSMIVIHWVLPAILPDFQTDSITASLILAFLLGVVVIITGLTTKEFDTFSGGEGREVFGTKADLNEKPLGIE